MTQRVSYDRLVLTACHPLYSAAERIVVFARLVRRDAADMRSGEDPIDDRPREDDDLPMTARTARSHLIRERIERGTYTVDTQAVAAAILKRLEAR